MTLELPFEDALAADLDELLEELDAALDASFLGDLKDAFERAACPLPGAGAGAGALA